MYLNSSSSGFVRFLAGMMLVTSNCVDGLGEDPLPTAFPNGRYDLLRKHSPFAMATVEAPPVPPTASFAANWFISSLARVGNDDFVTIKSRDLGTQFSLFGKGDSVGGVALASVTWSETIGKSTVILCKGAETAKLEFNEAQIKAAPPSLPPGPGAPPMANGAHPMPDHNPAPRPANALPAGPQNRRGPQVILPPSSH